MREIKFRGKRVDNGEWVYGNLLSSEVPAHDPVHWCEIHVPFADDPSVSFFRVIPETVGQFTGLHDKNRKEIYEGDIVISFKKAYEDAPTTNTVEFAKGCWRLICKGVNDVPLFNYYSKELEVIGNIY